MPSGAGALADRQAASDERTGVPSKQRRVFGIAAPLFFVSGGTALLYQVAFGKKLATIFGATAYAVSAVLAAFMAGLALGAHLGGRYGERVRRPLAVYGVAEIVVGAVCALTPLLFEGISVAYVYVAQAAPSSLAALSVGRALITAMVVLVPTVAMGATLPLLARAIAGQTAEARGDVSGSRRRLSWLYACNTAGGALGALVSGYLVLPALGVYSTMRAAAVVNLLIGSLAIAVGRNAYVDASPSDAAASPALDDVPDAQPISAPESRLLGVLAFASGLLVFCAEVVDTHLLTLLIGNSAYAFGLMLAVFLTCLSFGAAASELLEKRFGASALPVSLSCTAFAVLLTLPLWERLPDVFVFAGYRISSWAGREAVRASVAMGALLAPTICMGMTFPLLLRRVATCRDVSLRVGRLTSINTIGSIAGSIACGYLVLPALGSEWTLRGIGLCFAACALAAAWWQRRAGASGNTAVRRSALALAACTALLVLLPRWDLATLTNGANVYFDVSPPPEEILFVREDVHGGVTSVVRNGSVKTLYTNGKFQGNDGGEVTAQRSFAHFPSLFVPRFDRALVIGLGTGTTLGTIAAYPYQHIDVAEISPSIEKAARLFFSSINRRALDDPRVHRHLNDGRNHLLLATVPYDLITIELTSVWFAGAANLYSLDFYELCRQRLQSDGVLQQWVQLHHIHRRELAVALRTLRHVFPHVALFVNGSQGIAVASGVPLRASRARLAELSAMPAIRETLGGGDLGFLIHKLMVSGPDLDRFVADSEGADGPVLTTDENLYLEYATPKGNVLSYEDSIHDMMALLETYRTEDPVARHVVD